MPERLGQTRHCGKVYIAIHRTTKSRPTERERAHRQKQQKKKKYSGSYNQTNSGKTVVLCCGDTKWSIFVFVIQKMITKCFSKAFDVCAVHAAQHNRVNICMHAFTTKVMPSSIYCLRSLYGANFYPDDYFSYNNRILGRYECATYRVSVNACMVCRCICAMCVRFERCSQPCRTFIKFI